MGFRIDDIDESFVEEKFRHVCKFKFKREVDYSPLVTELGKLKDGGALTYPHLEKIADPEIWPFKKYWMWPPKEQIQKKLKKTVDLFKNLTDSLDKEEEREVIQTLYNIFKHIELVSIILRFVDPINYAIYSPPVAKILNPPRGEDYVSEYLNYLGELRRWRDISRFKRVAYVEMFLWAVGKGYKRDVMLKMFFRKFADEISETQQMKILSELASKPQLKQTERLLKLGAVDMAAGLAARVFVRTIIEKSKKYGIWEWGKTRAKLIDELCGRLGKSSENLHTARDLRNKAAGYSTYYFKLHEVEFMIEVIKELQRW